MLRYGPYLVVNAAVDAAIEAAGAAETAGFRLSEKPAVAAVLAAAKRISREEIICSVGLFC